MHILRNKLVVIGALGATLMLAGCATVEQAEHAQATADQALSGAQQAQQSATAAGTAAQHAQASADQAMSTAQAAQASANKAQSDVATLSGQVEALKPLQRRAERD